MYSELDSLCRTFLLLPSHYLYTTHSTLFPSHHKIGALLVMIGFITDDGKCTVELFGKDRPHDLMGKGHF